MLPRFPGVGSMILLAQAPISDEFAYTYRQSSPRRETGIRYVAHSDSVTNEVCLTLSLKLYETQVFLRSRKIEPHKDLEGGVCT